jgi:integrase
MFKSAESGDLVLRNPMRKVKAPPQEKPKAEAMNAEQTQAFLEAADRAGVGFMFALAFHLGARPGEWLAIQWADCDLKARRVSIRRTLKWRRAGDWYTTPPKTEKGRRDIPITPEIVRGLEDHRRRQLEMRLKAGADWADNGFVFADPTGGPFDFERVRRLHKKILADAGLPETFALKTSRHTCASALLKAGVHPKIVSDRLGHSSISITLDVYTSVEEDQQRAASEALGEMFGGGKK